MTARHFESRSGARPAGVVHPRALARYARIVVRARPYIRRRLIQRNDGVHGLVTDTEDDKSSSGRAVRDNVSRDDECAEDCVYKPTDM